MDRASTSCWHWVLHRSPLEISWGSPWAERKYVQASRGRKWKSRRETEGTEVSSLQEPIRQQLFFQKMRLFLTVTVKWLAINSSWGNAPVDGEVLSGQMPVLQAHIYWFTLLFNFFPPGCLLAGLNGRRDRPTWLGTILRDPRLEVGMGKSSCFLGSQGPLTWAWSWEAWLGSVG